MAKVRNPLPITVPWTGAHRRELYLDNQIKKHTWQVGAEIGVRFGRTLFHLLNCNPSLVMYAIDIDIDQFWTPAVQAKYGQRLKVLAGTSWEQAQHIKQSLDFVFIDAAHGTKSVVRDIRAYQPLVKTTAGLLGHDADYPSVQAALAQCGIAFDVAPDNVWQAR